MGTTKDDLMVVVNKLIADVEVQTTAAAERVTKENAVVVALQEKSAAEANHSTAQATVKADLSELVRVAEALSDEDDAT